MSSNFTLLYTHVSSKGDNPLIAEINKNTVETGLAVAEHLYNLRYSPKEIENHLMFIMYNGETPLTVEYIKSTYPSEQIVVVFVKNGNYDVRVFNDIFQAEKFSSKNSETIVYVGLAKNMIKVSDIIDLHNTNKVLKYYPDLQKYKHLLEEGSQNVFYYGEHNHKIVFYEGQLEAYKKAENTYIGDLLGNVGKTVQEVSSAISVDPLAEDKNKVTVIRHTVDISIGDTVQSFNYIKGIVTEIDSTREDGKVLGVTFEGEEETGEQWFHPSELIISKESFKTF